MKYWSGTVSLKSNYAGLHEYAHEEAETFEDAISLILDRYTLNGKKNKILQIELRPTTAKHAMDTGIDLGERQVYKP